LERKVKESQAEGRGKVKQWKARAEAKGFEAIRGLTQGRQREG
jgi:hypothetical protein